MSQFSEKTQDKFEKLHKNNVRSQEPINLQKTTIHTLQEGYAKLRKASEETNKRLKQRQTQRKSVEATKKKNSCHNFGPTDHYLNNFPKAKKNFYAIEKFPEEEFPTEDSESDSMGDVIREHSDDDHNSKEEFLVEYQEETQLGTQDIQLEAGMPQDTAKKSCVNTHKMHRPS
ncbi:hypothetical protein O181_004439 [Austropuccinia psidii MF-1]|uniref:Uncharacterized protein n=1 Tax=Austropuccinia psidii MF-1 TaxID=1389203 RepID=A0A9Q3GEV3_9BASI|nr:hypothetical protein [Austropuccinia psidii MF-1]